MDLLKHRFPYLDERLLPYLQKVLERIPSKKRQDILSNDAFQMVGVDDLRTACTLCMSFDSPVQTIIAVNTMMLREPEYRIVLALAARLAGYICLIEKSEDECRDAEVLLKQWGFASQLAAARKHTAMSGSEGYQVGYRWAIRQSPDYLRQHFGLYMDALEKHPWGDLVAETESASESEQNLFALLEEVVRVRPPDYPALSFRTATTGPLPPRTVFLGIMDAFRALESHEQGDAPVCKGLDI